MMSTTLTPQPAVMPIDRETWRKQLHLSNFVNAYYQYRDVQRWVGDRPRILIIGPGQGLDTEIFRWRGCDVTTLDIDDTFKPDVIGSCHEMPMFATGAFDAVIASHVLEHLPVAFLDRALAEIARVGRVALFYLPVAGRSTMLRWLPGFKGLDLAAIVDVRRFWERPDGVHARYCGGQHYWEVGYRGFTVRDLKRRFESGYRVIDCYRNRDWLPSQNFVLESLRNAALPAR